LPEAFALAGVPGPPRRRAPLGPLLVGAALALGAFVYPFVAAGALERWGVRAVAAALLGVSVLSLALSPLGLRRAARARVGAELGVAPGLGVALLSALAAWSGERLWLLLVPSWAWAVAAWLFWHSARAGSSLLETGVRLLHPYAPDFIGPYCRRLTLAWSAFLLANALAFAALALAAPLGWWHAYTRWGVYALMLALGAAEFVFRKAWFRYYPYGGPVDRVFAALFPSQNTAAGRRSHAYIVEMRRKLLREAARAEDA
jgi:uncharacterized membrane protein